MTLGFVFNFFDRGEGELTFRTNLPTDLIAD